MHDYWVEFAKVAVAHLLAVASPGPDFAIVLKQSLSRGRAAALWTSVGVGAAILLHVTYSLLGFGLLLKSSALWFNVVKFAGAAYIGWLGLQSLRAQPRATDAVVPGGADEGTTRGAFATGFFTNALNLKATLFFISLFVMVISPHTPKVVQAGYGLWMAVATAAWFCLVSILFTHADVRRTFLRYGHWIDRVLGVVFLGFAVSLVVTTID
jgi:RhtB (resistance to homoserine/threonine) family protein